MRRFVLLPNVPSDLSLPALGIPPAREAESAGGLPKVPKGQGLGRLARWVYSFFFCNEPFDNGSERVRAILIVDVDWNLERGATFGPQDRDKCFTLVGVDI